jgi:ferric-dicitrate binding protein FerR (iron transport regulator)
MAMANFQFLQNIQELIAKYLRGELSEGENAELQAWINASPANAAHFEELINAERLIEKMRIWQEGSNGKERGWQKIEQQLGGRSVVWFRLQWIKVAAAVLLLIGGAVWFWLTQAGQKKAPVQVVQNSTQPANDIAPGGFKAKLTLSDGSSIILDTLTTGKLAEQGNTSILNKNGQLTYSPPSRGAGGALYNTLSTSNGQTYKALLSDGSTVWLNAGSSIHYPVSFTGKERKVEITGEVYFEVVHLTNKVPFIVKFSSPPAGGAGGVVEVLGTHFNINSYSDETTIRTTLLEGSVKITSSGSGQQAILKPGQQAQLAARDKAIKVTNEVDTEEVLAWKDGKFIFNDLDLPAAMRQIERWYDVQVSYGYDAAKKPLQVNGEISRYTNVSKVLDIMKSTGWLDFSIEGKKITILSK